MALIKNRKTYRKHHHSWDIVYWWGRGHCGWRCTGSTWLVGLVVGVVREPTLFGYGSDSSSSMPPCASPFASAGVLIVLSRIGIRSSRPILHAQVTKQNSNQTLLKTAYFFTHHLKCSWLLQFSVDIRLNWELTSQQELCVAKCVVNSTLGQEQFTNHNQIAMNENGITEGLGKKKLQLASTFTETKNDRQLHHSADFGLQLWSPIFFRRRRIPLFTGQMYFLQPSYQCQSTEGKRKHNP